MAEAGTRPKRRTRARSPWKSRRLCGALQEARPSCRRRRRQHGRDERRGGGAGAAGGEGHHQRLQEEPAHVSNTQAVLPPPPLRGSSGTGRNRAKLRADLRRRREYGGSWPTGPSKEGTERGRGQTVVGRRGARFPQLERARGRVLGSDIGISKRSEFVSLFLAPLYQEFGKLERLHPCAHILHPFEVHTQCGSVRFVNTTLFRFVPGVGKEGCRSSYS